MPLKLEADMHIFISCPAVLILMCHDFESQSKTLFGHYLEQENEKE